ncbi:hypothetical protein QQS21_003320 [Conoideocrella luteorostrata]|uniref:Nephrocystin 3-like N-terminal domain-containing protein n=1 Tax=Conoideocrella luteorostrata TaxID=1105319 RepID=A0AAJ0FVP1_9HYPO|nr:hypothetical protein QQS21_003320 [Conoideocrella luteorostrata]
MGTSEQQASIISDTDSDLVVIDDGQVSNYNPEQMLPKPLEVIQGIRSWLQPTSYDLPSGEYRKHLASHVAGTGSWLTNDQTYKDWLEHSGRGGLLWIQGCPGSGKSVMAAKLVHELAEANPDCPVLFFFFRQIIDANHEPQALLRDWMDQLLDYSPPLQAKLETYVKEGRSIDTMSMEDMWKDLRMAFSSLPKKVFCVADALDEMDHGNDAFLAALGGLGKWRPDKVKVLMTSRLVPKLEVPLRGLPCIRIRLEETKVDIDISTFVRQALGRSVIAKDDWARVMDAVPGRANGIFLYAKLAMDAFLEDGADVNTVLSQLPVDLNVLYTNLLQEHAARSGVSRDIQDLLLQSVTHASRPLRLLELADMIQVHLPAEHDTQGLKAAKDLIRIACGPLLEILPDETVSVVHHSFTEYLKGATRSDADKSHFPVLKAGPAHARLATVCLQYMLSGCLSSVNVVIDDDVYAGSQTFLRRLSQNMKVPHKHPFSKYAVDNWHHHIHQSEAAGYNQQDVTVLVASLLDDTSSRKAWLQLAWQGGRDDAGEVTQLHITGSVTQLHIAGRAGLLAYTRELLKTMEVDQVDATGKTALWWAAEEGHAETVGALLAAGASPEKDDCIHGLKPLHQAAKANHALVVTRLLQAGADALTPKTKEDHWRWCGDAPSDTGHTPLMYACHNGHMEALSAFLPFLNKEGLQRALHWAAEKVQAQAVARIIQQPGVDVNATVCGVTPLYLACACGDLDSVRALILAGADTAICSLDAGPEFGGMRSLVHSEREVLSQACLHALVGFGLRARYETNRDPEAIREIFSLLVDSGVDIHQRNGHGQTALHGVTTSPVLTRLLLDAGADANAKDNYGSTPLHYDPSVDVISILVEEGQADINAVRDDGQTPLLRMLRGMSWSSILAFLEYGPDCSATDNNGDGALHMLLGRYNASGDVAKALLKRNANPSLRNKKGLTPLLLLRAGCSTEDNMLDVFDALINAGADPNEVDRQGRTLLFYMISGEFASSSSQFTVEGVIKSIKSLMERGAIASCRDNRGRTLLHEAIAFIDYTTLSSSRVLESLADLGMDLNALDHSGNSLLHELAKRDGYHDYPDGREYVPLYGKLLDLGLDIEQRNYKGQTALHVLCSANVDDEYHRRPLTAIDYVMSMMKTVDVADNEGITPLHMACTLGQVYPKKLLNAGADATRQTHEGLSALHLAARYRQSNVVGMLLEHLRARQRQIAADGGDANQETAWLTKHVNATPTTATLSYGDYTPLHFACQSGTPETVGILLEAGADLKMPGLLEACRKFTGEEKRWTINQKPDMLALKLSDTCRGLPGRTYSGGPAGLPFSVETRMEEIVDMLLERGARPAKRVDGFYYRLDGDTWDAEHFNYANTCAQQRLDKYRPEEEENYRVHSPSFSQLMHENMARTADDIIRGLTERDDAVLGKGCPNVDIFVRLLVSRMYHSIPLLQEMGTDFLVKSKRYGMSNLALLAYHGFASLVEKIGCMEANARFADGEWHAYGDSSRPGLWQATTKKGNNHDDRQNKQGGDDGSDDDFPLLLRAVQRVQPNLDVVKVLVEKLGVNPNQVTPTGEIPAHETDTSALLHVAEGHSWWHAHQAVPYLIQQGADMEITNYRGQTPLQVALAASKTGGIFSKEASRVLVHAGANVNAVDSEGMSCLAHATHDIDLMHLLLDNGSRVTPTCLLTAIDSNKVEIVRVLLSRGADANMRPDKNDIEGKPKNMRLWPGENDVESWDLFALYHAAHTHETEARREIIRLLLQHGADPMAKYLRRVRWTEEGETGNDAAECDVDDDGESSAYILAPTPTSPTIAVPRNYQECTIMHSLLREDRATAMEEFLRLPRLDVNCKDADGQTVLLAACASRDGLDHPVHPVHCSDGPATTVFRRLLALGADIKARDNAGRNALHYLSLRSCRGNYRSAESPVSLQYILGHAPALMHQVDIGGCTPLHFAMLASARRDTTTRPAMALLDAGANASAVTNTGETALHILAPALGREDGTRLFKLLVEKHCLDVNARNKRGETPVFAWCKSTVGDNRRYPYGESEGDYLEGVTGVLKELGADFCARDGEGRSLLHVLAGGRAERFQFLMDLGVDAMLEDNGHQTAIDVAAARGNKDVLRLFEKK